jgi:hypothetical protein
MESGFSSRVRAPSIVAVTFWPKKRYWELQEELAQEAAAAATEKRHRATLTSLQRIDEDLANIDAQPTDFFSDKYYAAQRQRIELMKQRPAAVRDQKIRDLAEQIKARRGAGQT